VRQMSERYGLPDEESPPILDVRPAADFERLHFVGAVNIPLEELPRRIHELPPKTTAFAVFDEIEERAQAAESGLAARGRRPVQVLHGSEWPGTRPTEAGPSRTRLWRPHRLLEEAVEEAQRAWGTLRGRRALDLACGSGRDAVFLALAGFEVAAWDVLPDAVALCRDLGGRNGVCVNAEVRDLRAVSVIGSGTHDLIACFYYLHRPLMRLIMEAVSVGGLIVFETFVDPQRELHGRPRRASLVLRRDELREWFTGWDVVVYHEGDVESGRHAASLIAKRR
jgi:tellurite methyltransferase